MKKHIFYSLVACILLGTACQKDNNESDEPVTPSQPIELSIKQSEKVSGDNAFALRLFQQVAMSDDGANAFVSPLSITMAMGMLYNGTSGNARTEMAEALDMSGFSDEEINEYYQKISQALLNIDPLTTLMIANSIWFKKDYPVKQSFFDINQKYYDAEVRELDFGAPASVDIINNWCAKNTNNKIDKIINQIPGDAVMYLINAVYFKSKWQFQFDKKDTKTAKFTLQDGSQTNVSMMEQTTDLPYYANDKLQCVEMPYGNQAFSMVVLLPAEGNDLGSVVEYFDHGSWEKVLAGLYDTNVRLKFPRFKQECEFSLNNPLKDIGMKSIFQTGYLNNIADNSRLCVSEVRHKTFVEVNEEGTEAAAITSVEVLDTAYPGGGPVRFYADRPFVYLIKEKSTGVILFIGRMDHPKE